MSKIQVMTDELGRHIKVGDDGSTVQRFEERGWKRHGEATEPKPGEMSGTIWLKGDLGAASPEGHEPRQVRMANPSAGTHTIVADEASAEHFAQLVSNGWHVVARFTKGLWHAVDEKAKGE